MARGAFDAAVVGGGPVGGCCALALAAAGMRVALVGPRPAGPPAALAAGEADYDLRVLALTRASERILARLGLWAGIAAGRHGRFRAMRVWDAASPAAVRFDADELGEPVLGWTVEQSRIVEALWRRLEAEAESGTLALVPARVESLEPGGAGDACLGLDGAGGTLRARLVVAADGADSRVRELAGIAVRGGPYEQRAVVATLACERPHRLTAWQRFLPDGPIALLPLDDFHRVSIVWSTTPAHADALLEMEPEAFAGAVTEAAEARLGAMTLEGPRAAYALRHQHAAAYVEGRVALVGDAAHVIHPLAGQGFNLGLLDAAALAECAAAAWRAHGDPGAAAALARYQRWRRGENLAMGLLMEAFRSGFGARALPVRAARALAFAVADRCVPLRRALVRRAMGLEGDLPGLARVRCVETAGEAAP